MKRIAIFTTTRAEFGILTPLIHAMNKSSQIENLLFVGGTHLSKNHGHTIDEIKNEGFNINDTFDYIPLKTDTKNISESLAKETTELTRIFSNHSFDAICILGDRYELLPIVQTAILFRKIIIHIHGGEKSEGVIDEQIRHMITKSAHIHFAACDDYAQNIRKMGESEWRVFNTGALAVDNMINTEKISKDVLYKDLNLNPSEDVALLTYHPVTLENNLNDIEQVRNVFEAIKAFNIQIIVTAPNVEVNRNEILEEILKQLNQNNNYHYIESLGRKRYLSLLPHCKFVIGNSSSGIIEAPFYKIPTINIGERQKGRIRHQSIIDTQNDVNGILSGIKKALDPQFLDSLQNMKYIFGEGQTSQKMIEILESIKFDKKLLSKTLDFTC